MLLCCVSPSNLSLLSSHISDSPEVRIEETWKPSGESFEVELQCHVTSYPSAKVRLQSIGTGEDSIEVSEINIAIISHTLNSKTAVSYNPPPLVNQGGG